MSENKRCYTRDLCYVIICVKSCSFNLVQIKVSKFKYKIEYKFERASSIALRKKKKTIIFNAFAKKETLLRILIP